MRLRQWFLFAGGFFLVLCLNRTYAQGRFSSLAQGEETLQKIQRTAQGYALQYGFKNFNGDAWTLSASLSEEDVAASIQEFGYKRGDLEKLDVWYQAEQKSAISDAQQWFIRGQITAESQEELERKLRDIKARNARVQTELDAKLSQLSRDYRRRRTELYQKAGFQYKSSRVLEVDIPALVRHNAPRVRSVAKAFGAQAAGRGYGSEELVGAVTAMVQTALRYEVPQNQEGGRVIGGVLPPPKTLVLGQGDCDTKTALLASILKNWPDMRMVGLAIPGHYLMAVHRIPRRGDVFIEHEGLPYVMVESAGPAWLEPGSVGERTQAYLDEGNLFRIQAL